MNTKAIAAAACLWVPVAASAADDQSTKIDSLSKRFEQILATQGISVGGQFRGMYGAADFSGNSLNKLHRDDEQIGYTSVDFDLRAKPNTVTQARAIFRMHLDHASFFGAPYTPLETRWLSIDGAALDGMLYYHLGNMLQKWSPLTMWSPEVGYLYTPRIFAQEQKTAMDERFLGNNNRNLQGVNVGFRAAIPAAKVDSFDVSLLAARLLVAAPLGESSFDQFISNYHLAKKGFDATPGWPTKLANYDRILLGARSNWAFLGGVQIGANFLQNKDLKSTFGTTDTADLTMVTFSKPGKADSVVYPAARQKDSLLTNGIVVGATLKADGAKLLGHSKLVLGLDAEYAHSSWDYFEHSLVYAKTSSTDVDPGTGVVTKTETGAANPQYTAKAGNGLNVGIKAGWNDGNWSAAIRAGYLKNDSLFRSDLAQTPVFNKRFGRVYNSEQDSYLDTGTFAGYTRPLHYNLFDAMYHNVHHWIAEERNEYAKNAYDKLAYSNYVAGSAQEPFSSLTTSLNTAKASFDQSTSAYAKLRFRADSIKALVVKNATDSVVAGLKKGTNALTDSGLAVSYVTTVGASKVALYQTALDFFQLDRDLQYVLPGGEASANRVGPKFGLDAQYANGGVELTVNGYMLQEAKGTELDSATQASATVVKFQSMEAGLRGRFDRFFPKWNTLLNPKAPLPLEATVSFSQSTAKGGLYLDYASTQLGASAYVGIVPRLSLLVGFQQVKGDDKTVLEIDRNCTNLAGGLEYKIQDGAYFLAQYNKLKTEFPNATEFDFAQDIWSTKISVSF